MNRKRLSGLFVSAAVVLGICTPISMSVANAATDTAFVVNEADLRFILTQIQISEAHAAQETGTCVGPVLTVADCVLPATTPLVPTADPNAVPAVTDIPSPDLPWGLRQIDGRNNTLLTAQGSDAFSSWNGVEYLPGTDALPIGKSAMGSSGQPFTRMTAPLWRDVNSCPDFVTCTPSNYVDRSKTVLSDAQIRIISNLVSDQSANNPAAVIAAGPGASPTIGAVGDGSYIIPNVAPAGGVFAPYNGLFALFGQFFDHGLDLVGKQKSNFVLMPLSQDDPLYVPGGRTNFMLLNRTDLSNSPAGVNSTTPWIDQNQTYGSHPSKNVFMRDYACATNAASSVAGPCVSGVSTPVSTGELLNSAIAHNIANWAEVKANAVEKLGIELTDYDVTDVPLVVTDEFGRFIKGPNGFPMVVLKDGSLKEGNPANPVKTADFTQVAGAVDLVQRTGHSFLDDIAHGAAPKYVFLNGVWTAQHDVASLNKHFITGDGRGNENIGLTAIHTVFHAEHNRLVNDIMSIVSSSTDADFRAQWHVGGSIANRFNGEYLMQAAIFINQMEYQHLVFEEFARRIQPGIPVFGGYDYTTNSEITAEFAHAVYRFGHSQLNPTVDRIDSAGNNQSLKLLDAFLNPAAFNTLGGAQVDGAEAAGSIIQGMTKQVGNEIDEFVTDTLRNNLLGLPLDLASLNIARGRDSGMQSLNGIRREFYNSQTAGVGGNVSLKPYSSWMDFSFNIQHPASIINLIAAYGLDPSIVNATTVATKRDAALKLWTGNSGLPAGAAKNAFDANRNNFLFSTGSWANNADGSSNTGLEQIDLWVGGLAEARPVQAVAGGMLGSTFDHIFSEQMRVLQDGDRLYYLARTAGMNLGLQLEVNSLSQMMMRNTTAANLPALTFDTPTATFDMTKAASNFIEILVDPVGTWLYNGIKNVIFGGTSSDDRMSSGSGNDTMHGFAGNDWLSAGGGNDHLYGGSGNDIMLDTSGNNVFNGDDGDDYMQGGLNGLNVFNCGRGNDMVVASVGGVAVNCGPGNDLAIGGAGGDAVNGDDGDDYIMGSAGNDVLLGDSLGLINGIQYAFDGRDAIFGGSGDDSIGGGGFMDIIHDRVGANGIDGGFGYDWHTYYDKGVTTGVFSDLSLLVPPIGNIFAGALDTHVQIEGLSGGAGNDQLFGDTRTDLLVPPAVAIPVGAVAGSDELLATDVELIRNLNRVLAYAGGVVGDALSARGTGVNQGNMILGGPGSDQIQGWDGNDVIHGDAFLEVAYSVPFAGCATGNTGRLDPFDNSRVIATDLTWIASAVREGRLNIADVLIRRMIDLGAQKDDGAAVNSVDTAVFDGFLDTTTANGSINRPFLLNVATGDYVMTGSEFVITVRASDKAVIVDDVSRGDEGRDILIGIEKLTFNGNGGTAGGLTSPAGVPTTIDLRTAIGLPANFAQSGELVHEVLANVACTGTATPVVSGGTVVIPTLPAVTVAPTVSVAASISNNTPNAGETVIGSVTFSGTPAPLVAYQWLSCSASGPSGSTLPAGCVAISGATTTTYLATIAQLGKFIRFSATATNSAGTISSFSASSSNAVALAVPGQPDLAASSDLGVSATDNITYFATPLISVSGVATGATVTVTAAKSGSVSVTCSFVAASSVGECTLGTLALGQWSITAIQASGGSTTLASSAVVITIEAAPIPEAPAAGGGATPAPASVSTPEASPTTTIAPASPIVLPGRNTAIKSKNNSTFFFANASSTLSAQAKKNLDKLVAELKSGSSVSITGFTSGTQASSLALADSRAKNVAKYLKAKGVNSTIQKSTGGVLGGSVASSRRVVIEWQVTK
jgi:Ca2+-binding RTX toxin-like protein